MNCGSHLDNFPSIGPRTSFPYHSHLGYGWVYPNEEWNPRKGGGHSTGGCYCGREYLWRHGCCRQRRGEAQLSNELNLRVETVSKPRETRGKEAHCGSHHDARLSLHQELYRRCARLLFDETEGKVHVPSGETRRRVPLRHVAPG